MANEQIRYDILVNAKDAIKQLREMSESAESVQERVAKFSGFLVLKSREWNVPLKQLLDTFRKINAELAKNKKSSIFGNVGGQNIFNMSDDFLKSAQSAGRFKVDMDGVVQSVRTAKGQMDIAEQSVKKTGDSLDGAGKKARGFSHGIDVVRTALGTLTAVGIFQFLSFVSDAFNTAIKNAREFEETLFRLSNVERLLSMEGVEISMKGLKDGIKALKEEFPIFSKEDIAQMVGSLATTTSELGYTEEQLLDLAKAILVLNVNSTETETILQTQQKVTTALLSGTTKGVSSLGVQLNDTVIKAKAVEMGFIDAGDGIEKLTKREKDLAKLNIVLERSNQLGETMNSFLGTNSAKLMENKAAWNDMLTTLGQVILPFIPALTKFFQTVNDGLNAGKVVIIEFVVRLAMLAEALRTIANGDFANFASNIKRAVEDARSVMTNEFFKEMPENAPEWFKKGWGDLIKQDAETATSGVNEFGEATKALDTSALEKIRDIFKDTANAVQDLVAKLNQKLADLNTEYARKQADAETDYLRKVEDINRDYLDDLAKLKRKHRREDEQDEAKYQLALWELRMRYLMDLEDALHARDARQVIRLQKQYAIDKEALRRKHDLENREREQRQQDEVDDLELQRQRRLEDARLEYQQKLADLNLAKQREAEDLALWYEREFADLQLAQDRKLKELLDGWAREQQITEENAAEVYAILQRYFGPGGLTDALYQYMMQSLIASTQGAIAAAASMMGQLGTHDTGGHTTTGGGSSGGHSGGGGSSGSGRGEGGTLIATRPTSVLFGEAGPEVATFTPLNRIGKNEGKVDFSGPASGLFGGEIVVALNLSPDLEARVVENSMNGVAEVVTRINRSK